MIFHAVRRRVVFGQPLPTAAMTGEIGSRHQEMEFIFAEKD